MKILVTGCHGQVGQALSQHLQGLGEIHALGREQLDLADPLSIRQVMQNLRPAMVINAAAYTAVDQAESEEALAMRINAEAPGILAEEAKKIGASLIHYSTDYVFDGSKQGAWNEDDAVSPLSAYGRSKLAGEQAIAAVGIPYLILRTSWVYGLHGKNFLLTMLRLAQSRDSLSIVDDQIGAPTWSHTIAEATASIVKQFPRAEQIADHRGIYHLCATGHTSWYGFAQAIFSHPAVQKRPALQPITTAQYPTPARRPANSVMRTEKFRQRFGELPSWQDALHHCLNDLHRHDNGLSD
jgi:dTDP-4-dehydrorhamnose reductase